MPPIRKLAFVINTEKEGAAELGVALTGIASAPGPSEADHRLSLAAGYLRARTPAA